MISHTGGLIGGMLRPADLPTDTQLLLTTALYFRANWGYRFAKENTIREPFHRAPGDAIEVPMMNRRSDGSSHGYFRGDSFHALEFTCGSNRSFAMVVLLPREVDGLAGLEAALTPELLEAIWPRLAYPEEVIIALPKFRIRAEMALKGPLSELGMPLAFEPGADFSGINGKPQDLRLSAVKHAAIVDVDEEGIEAGAPSPRIRSPRRPSSSARIARSSS